MPGELAHLKHLGGVGRSPERRPASPQAYLIYSSSVAAGAQSGIEECKYQFAWDRWNCPERALQLSSHGGLRSGKEASAGSPGPGPRLEPPGPPCLHHTLPLWPFSLPSLRLFLT